jgi:FkbM family methyltransferase
MMALVRRAIARLIFLLPPLSRLREHNLRLQRRVERQHQALNRLDARRERERLGRDAIRTRLSRCRATLAERTRDVHGLRMLTTEPGSVLQRAFAHRASTVLASQPAPDLQAREQDWRAACPAYAIEAENVHAGRRPPGARTVEIGGLTWWLPNDAASRGSLSSRIVDRGWLPLDDLARVRRLVVGGGMLDIGANIGTTAIPRALLRDFSVIHAAEPDPDNYACLVANVLANRLDGAVLPDRVAISSSTGMVRLRLSTQIGTHHLLPAEGKTHLPSIDVQAYTVDDWIGRLGVLPADLSFVKVDAQGWDAHVILGARSLLAARHLVWQVEFSPVMMDRSGVTVREFNSLASASFTHFRMMAGDERERPISDVSEVGAALAADGRYANLLLYSKA